MAVVALVGACSTPSPEAASPATDTVAVAPPAPAPVPARPVHWGYGEEAGPASWGSLSPVYALCGNGKGQSPIALTSGTATSGPSWSFDYRTTRLAVAHHEHVENLVDNGHTIQVTVDEGSTLTLNGTAYTLKQFHVHTPSEHTIDGKNMPMEVHLVHQDSAGNFAVVGVLVKEGAANANFAKLVANLPAAKGDTVAVAGEQLDLTMHLPAREKAYHYVGSLTTPPCSENVQWLVLQDMITLSKDQIQAFSSRIGPNNRPTQPLNTRTVSSVGLSGSMR
ncbi:MAG: carbonic anhydrase family protein [Flavobacteriales bacterium]|nr:carbonic anhydrase family protein [Flavobacteriales bacterium]